MASDLEQLLEMGFDKERAELAVKQSGGLQGALEWLEKNQDTPIDELQEESLNAAPVAEGAVALSLVCNECGKKFRNQTAAEFHASKTEHTDFAESTEEIAPLTEEEKKTKLAELREKARLKREAKSQTDKEENKRNEQIRQKATRETQEMKEELARKEQIKQAAKKRQEKQDDLEAKKRIKAQIEADKEERRRKAEEAKALREGRSAAAAAAPAPAPAAASSSAPKQHTEARLRLQTPASGNVVKTFPAETTLFEVAQQLSTDGTAPADGVSRFVLTFPRKTFEGVDFGKTLKEAGLVPSAVLIVQ